MNNFKIAIALLASPLLCAMQINSAAQLAAVSQKPYSRKDMDEDARSGILKVHAGLLERHENVSLDLDADSHLYHLPIYTEKKDTNHQLNVTSKDLLSSAAELLRDAASVNKTAYSVRRLISDLNRRNPFDLAHSKEDAVCVEQSEKKLSDLQEAYANSLEQAQRKIYIASSLLNINKAICIAAMSAK